MPKESIPNKRIAFIDRDGVINKKAADHCYITSVSDFVFNDGIFEALKTLQTDGYELIIITNQRGIALGQYSERDLDEIHNFMLSVLEQHGIKILDIFYCPHNHNECDCRKPKPGLLKQATEKYPILICESILISDSAEEITMGEDFGIASNYLVPHDQPEKFLEQYKRKIRIAFIKYGGLSAGGTEKMLQTIAANLSREKFQVDYFYSASSPYSASDYHHPDTDPSRQKYMEDASVNCIKFHVEKKDITNPEHTWINNDFWSFFSEKNYDLIQTGRAGHKEYPFSKIKNTPLVDILALDAGVDNQYNIAKVLHVSEQNAQKWISKGGDKKRVEIISIPIEIPKDITTDLRQDLNLVNHFVYGMHQRVSDDIFSEIPLNAYKKIESADTSFLLLGGSDLYKKQTNELDIKNIIFLPETGDQSQIFRFLNTLDVYSHGRRDGEVNSQAMAEAMACGLPIVSHKSAYNNGHIENIGNAGVVTDSTKEYANELKRLKDDKVYYEHRRENALARFKEHYDLNGQINKIEKIYNSVLENPYPNKFSRIISSLHWTQNIRIWIKWLYLKINN